MFLPTSWFNLALFGYRCEASSLKLRDGQCDNRPHQRFVFVVLKAMDEDPGQRALFLCLGSFALVRRGRQACRLASNPSASSPSV
jgi:hypothetical protein